MISVILYGRNDSHGYNLHKRAAISFNTLAEILTDPADEILFVDFHTVDDLPTFPESIRDTLTEKARRKIRVIRVRSDMRRELRMDGRLPLNEPLARNIGIRRARPENTWILSTNTDMVFVPQAGRSLSELAATLPEGYYGLPRFEVPEILWETVDRLSPLKIMDAFSRWGRRYCLNETVRTKPYMRFDGPGDFQLFPREIVERMDGFDERMVYGWHVDRNLCKRMFLQYGRINSMQEHFLGYHCDHTRVTTPAHSSNRMENDWRFYGDDMERVNIPEQHETWGRPEEHFEEITFAEERSRYIETLNDIYTDMTASPPEITYSEFSFNSNLYYNTTHTFPYIADSLASAPNTLRLGYVGNNIELLRLLGQYWGGMGFKHPVLVHCPCPTADFHETVAALHPGQLEIAEDVAALTGSDLFLIDNHCSPDSAMENAQGFNVLKLSPKVLRLCINHLRALLVLGAAERRAVALGQRPRKFVVAGLQDTSHEAIFDMVLGLIAVPYSCHIRHGFVRPSADVEGLLDIFNCLNTFSEADLETLSRQIAEVYGRSGGEVEFEIVYRESGAKIDRELLFTGQPLEAAERASWLELAASLLLFSLRGNIKDAARAFVAMRQRKWE